MNALAACVGRIIWDVEGLETGSERVEFSFDNDVTLVLFHRSDCCETVSVAQVDGDAADLIGVPLVMAEVVSSDDQPAPNEYAVSFTWTFVKFATVKGYVTMRWLGTSNGHYGETPAIELTGKL